MITLNPYHEGPYKSLPIRWTALNNLCLAACSTLGHCSWARRPSVAGG
jgi:hypothetical protein